MKFIILTFLLLGLSLSATSSGSKYIGCFKDNGSRVLKKQITNAKTMTKNVCVAACKKAGYKYAGTQYASQCFCGNEYKKLGKATNCNMSCTGDKKQKCGGSWANSVYQVTASKSKLKKIAKVAIKKKAKKAVVKAKKTVVAFKALIDKAKKVIKKKAKKSSKKFTYKGCYKDMRKRDLLKYIGSFNNNSSKVCAEKCGKAGYNYAGTQYTKQCFCGYKFGKYGKAKNCDAKCPGNSKEKCGGTWANSVYEINKPSKKAAKKVIKTIKKK